MSLQEAMQQNPYIEESIKLDNELVKIPIKECGQPFSSLPILANHLNLPMVFDDNPEKLFYLRSNVADAVMHVVADLKKLGLMLKVEFAYRSPSQQSKRFHARVLETMQKYPQLSQGETLTVANMYTAGIPLLAAHIAGAAIDVGLLTLDGEVIDLGCPYLHGGPESASSYQNLSAEVLNNRQLLTKTMATHGLVNYPFEYWHFSMGDVFAAHFNGEDEAKFGPVEFQPDGTFEPMPSEKHTQFFWLGTDR